KLPVPGLYKIVDEILVNVLTTRNNMIVIEQPILTTCSENACDYTGSSLQKFKMTRFDDDIISLSAYDLAGC
ncbi:8507_t:CDS:2, partial [Funneliformis mosseae]